MKWEIKPKGAKVKPLKEQLIMAHAERFLEWGVREWGWEVIPPPQQVRRGKSTRFDWKVVRRRGGRWQSFRFWHFVEVQVRMVCIPNDFLRDYAIWKRLLELEQFDAARTGRDIKWP